MMMEVASSSINVWLPHITSRDYSFSHNKNTTQRPYTLLIGLQFNSLLSPQTLKTQKTHIHSPLLPQALYSSSSSNRFETNGKDSNNSDLKKDFDENAKLLGEMMDNLINFR